MEEIRGADMDYDLENSPLQIKTDSEIGSEEAVDVWLLTSGWGDAGNIHIFFSSPPRYRLQYFYGQT